MSLSWRGPRGGVLATAAWNGLSFLYLTLNLPAKAHGLLPPITQFLRHATPEAERSQPFRRRHLAHCHATPPPPQPTAAVEIMKVDRYRYSAAFSPPQLRAIFKSCRRRLAHVSQGPARLTMREPFRDDSLSITLGREQACASSAQVDEKHGQISSLSPAVHQRQVVGILEGYGSGNGAAKRREASGGATRDLGDGGNDVTKATRDMVPLPAARGGSGCRGRTGGYTNQMQILRHSVTDFPRLSRQEEAALSQDIQRWQQLEQLRRDAGGSEGIGVEAWARAAGMSVADLRKWVERGTSARERLVLSHVRLVMHLALSRGCSGALSPMDLVQEGAIALHMAVVKFDATRGFRFFTYADWALAATFEQTEATQAGTVRIPRYLYVEIRRLKAVVARETARRRRPPTRHELAAALDVTEKHVSRLLLWVNGSDSTDRVCSAGWSTLGDIISAPESLETFSRRVDAEVALARLLRKLKPQEAFVIVHRYGLFGRGSQSTPSVAAMLGVSPQYVGRVHRSALDKMRRVLGEDENKNSDGNSERGRQISSTMSISTPFRQTGGAKLDVPAWSILRWENGNDRRSRRRRASSSEAISSINRRI